jgi:hypothetical protein
MAASRLCSPPINFVLENLHWWALIVTHRRYLPASRLDARVTRLDDFPVIRRSTSIRLAALLAELFLVIRLPMAVRQAYADVGVWNEVASPTNETLYSAAPVPTSPGEFWAVGGTIGAGGDAIVPHFVNGAWSNVDISGLGLTSALLGVSFDSPADGWAVGDNGVILQFTSGNWFAINPNPQAPTRS